MIVIENDDAVTNYIERTLDIKVDRPCISFGFMTDDKSALCAILCNDFNGSNIEITMVSQRVTRGVLAWIANYAFNHAKCRRITVRAKKRNKRSIRFITRVGFRYEAVIKRYFSDDDAVLFRMYPEDCRW